MQDPATKQQESAKGRRTTPVQVVGAPRLIAPKALALREAQVNLARAEQNLRNLVQTYPNGASPPTRYRTGTGFAYAPGHDLEPAMGSALPGPFGGPSTPLLAASQAFIEQARATLAALAATLWPVGPQLNGLRAPSFFGADEHPTPACDIADEGKKFVCSIDLPGIPANQIEVICLEQSVIINAYREADADIANLVQSERHATVKLRTIALPAEIQPESAKASLGNGILTLELPKLRATAGPQRIKVQG